MHRTLFPLRFVLAAVLMAAAFPAFSQATRTWVSGIGDDVNPCSRTAPCKTFAGAISKTARGGIINLIDNGAYGTLTITKPVTIDGSRLHAGVLASATNGIIINIPAGELDRRVVLRGLSIDGAGNGLDPVSPSTSGLKGIRVLAADAVLIENLDIQNFLDAGIEVATAGSVNVTLRDVRIVRIDGPGVTVQTSAGTASLDARGVTVTDSEHGILAGNNSKVLATGVHVQGARIAAFAAQPAVGTVGAADLSVESSVASNGVTGVLASGADSRVTLASTAITGNATGLVSASGGVIASYGDNRIADNGTNGAPSEEVGLQ